MKTTVHLPVDIVSVRATFGPTSALTRLEQLVLRAIHLEGESSLPRLATLFGLNDRIALDLIWSLWTDGRVLVNLHSGTIRLAPAVSEAISQETLSELGSSRRKELTIELALDPVSGQVMTERDTHRGLPPGALVTPPPSTPVSITEVDTRDLVQAVLRHEDQLRSADLEDFRVLRVDLNHPFTSSGRAARRFRKVDVSSGVDDDDRLVAAVDDALAGLTSRQRSRIDTFLAESIECDPLGRLAQGLRSGAGTGLAPAPDVIEQLAAMGAEVERTALLGVQSQVLESAHDRLGYLLGAVRSELDMRRNSAVPTSLLSSTNEIRANALELIESARRQLVLACPWVNDRAFNALHDPLHQALKRGVHVVLLWGIRADERLGDSSANLLMNLRQEHPLRFHLSNDSSRTHAKLVVADDRSLLISSHNLLSNSGTLVELGVRVDARTDAPCPPIEAALGWARRNYPDYLVAQGFLVDHSQFASQRQPTLPPETKLPPPAEDVEQDRAAWRRAWTARVAELERQERATRQRVHGVIENQGHRHLLATALAEAQHRLIVASPQVGGQALTPAVLARLDVALSTRSGLVVTVAWAAPTGNLSSPTDSAMADLRALAERYAGRLRLAEIEYWHGKTLVWDDNVVLTSFNFLSFHGHYVESVRRSRSELGVRICDPALSEEVARAIERLAGLAPDGADLPRRDRERSTEPPPPMRVDAEIADAARDVLRCGADALLECVAQFDTLRLFDLLDELAEMGADYLLIERVAAAALIEGSGNDQRRSHWEGALAERAWNDHDFLLAHALFPATVESPSPALRLVAVTMDTDELGKAVAAATAAGVPRGEAVAVGLAAMYSVLRGQPEAEASLEQLDVLVRLRAATLKFWRTEYRAVPWSQLEARVADASSVESELQARTQVREQIRSILTWNSLNFAPGAELLSHLSRATSSFGELLAMEPRAELVDAWLVRWGPDANSFIDAHQGLAYKELISGSRRQSLVRKLDRLLRSLHAWRDALANLRNDVPNPPAVDELVDEVREGWAEVDAEAGEATRASQGVIDALAERLRAVRQ